MPTSDNVVSELSSRKSSGTVEGIVGLGSLTVNGADNFDGLENIFDRLVVGSTCDVNVDMVLGL